MSRSSCLDHPLPSPSACPALAHHAAGADSLPPVRTEGARRWSSGRDAGIGRHSGHGARRDPRCSTDGATLRGRNRGAGRSSKFCAGPRLARGSWLVQTLLLAAAGLALLPGCQKPTPLEPFQKGKDYERKLPPGALALRKIPPGEYPDFGPGFYNRHGLEQACRNSLEYLGKESSKRYFPYGEISHARAVASINRFLQILQSVTSPEGLDQAIREEFDVYESVGCDDAGTVLFTGYYTPIFEGRRHADARFAYPIYGYPPDLAKDADGNILGRRSPDGTVIPTYYSRREIEQGNLLRGREVAWVADPFEAYVITVQGSGKLRLEDGSFLDLAYAGNNGRDYTPVSKQMLADGVIQSNELSLQSLIRYFKAHPEDVNKYTWANNRTVFFKELSGPPRGCLNVPVLPYRSIATDKQVFPRACIAYVQSNLPRWQDGQVASAPYGGFALDQDAGGAIRAAGRCDVYMGIGPDAEGLAGRAHAEGKLYYVFVKDQGPSMADVGRSPGTAAERRASPGSSAGQK